METILNILLIIVAIAYGGHVLQGQIKRDIWDWE